MVWHHGVPPYPAALNDLEDPPDRLYAEGRASVLDAPLVTIVGSRQASEYGARVARAFGAAFARAGACVVSGLAYGVDIASHAGALDVGGRVCAVLGTGVNVAYPTRHRAMQRRIAEHGLLLSEYVAQTTARPWHFPQRNRLMAALGRATIVVEAAPSSGALLTARIAMDLKRRVGVVPGPIDSPTSVGSNALLHEPGVALITDTRDALGLMNISASSGVTPTLGSADEHCVWDALVTPASGVDELVARTALPTARCVAALGMLELTGAISIGYDGSIRRE